MVGYPPFGRVVPGSTPGGLVFFRCGDFDVVCRFVSAPVRRGVGGVVGYLPVEQMVPGSTPGGVVSRIPGA